MVSALSRLFKPLYEKPGLSLLFLVGATFLTYFNILDNGFVWDDFQLIVYAKTFHAWENVGLFFTQPFGYLATGNPVVYHRPVVPLLILFTSKLFGIQPFGFHLMSLMLQGAATLLFFSFLGWLRLDRKVVWFATLYFLFHPAHTQVVAWACSANIIVQGICLLGAFWLSLKLASVRSSGERLCLYAGLFFVLFLGLCSYELMIVLPALVFLTDWIRPFESIPRKATKQKMIEYSGYILVVVSFAAFSYSSVIHSIGKYEVFYDTTIANIVINGSPWERLYLPLNVLTRYTEMLIFPLVLAPDAFFKSTELSFSGMASTLLVLGLSLAMIRKGQRKKEVIFSLFWIYLPMLPVAQIFSLGGQFADRLLYLPTMGFALWFGLLVEWILSQKQFLEDLKRRRILLGAFVIFLAFLLGRTIQQNQVWQNDLTFWWEATIHTPEKAGTRDALGTALALRGHYEEAKKEYEAAMTLAPGFERAVRNYGEVHKYLGKEDVARRYKALADELKSRKVNNNSAIKEPAI